MKVTWRNSWSKVTKNDWKSHRANSQQPAVDVLGRSTVMFWKSAMTLKSLVSPQVVPAPAEPFCRLPHPHSLHKIGPCMYNVTFWRVPVTILVVEKQQSLSPSCGPEEFHQKCSHFYTQSPTHINALLKNDKKNNIFFSQFYLASWYYHVFSLCNWMHN
jgi:hypothetical protein